MAIESIDDLFVHALRDAYDMEKQHTKALKKLARKAGDEDLRDCFEQHLEETQEQLRRLDQIFETIGAKTKGPPCVAAQGLIEEAQHLLQEIEDEDLEDAAMIAGAQAMEHYEIARYGTLLAWARRMGERDAVRLLQQTLREEHAADDLLSRVAEQHINAEAFDRREEEEGRRGSRAPQRSSGARAR